MAVFDLGDLPARQIYSLLVGLVVPRPIAFVSSVSAEGEVNLSPFSYFNMVSSAPPTLIFSVSNPARGGVKDTLRNVESVREVVINLVDIGIVDQMNLASAAYPFHIDEFTKSGLTPLASVRVAPPRVAQALVAFECLVREIKPIGDGPGGANVVFCEVVTAHVADDIIDAGGEIDAAKMRPVARLGGAWYSVVRDDTLFELPRVMTRVAIGVDGIPIEIADLADFSPIERARLGLLEAVPEPAALDAMAADATLAELQGRAERAGLPLQTLLVDEARRCLAEGDSEAAWQMLLLCTRQVAA